MKLGTRVELHPATDAWMRGDRFGEVVGFARPKRYIDAQTGVAFMVTKVRVKLDVSGRVVRFHPDNLTAIERGQS